MISRYPIYYINLDRAPERAAFMDTQLSNLGLANSIQRVSAKDALTANIKSNCDKSFKTRRWELLPSEIACFESHRHVWERIVKNQQPYAVILEDDIILSKSFSKTVDCILDTISEFDVIKLDGCDHQQVLFGAAIHLGEFAVRPNLSRIGSSAGYLLSLSGAKKLMVQSYKYSDSVDDFIFEPRDEWNVLQLEPAIGVQGMFLDAKFTTKVSKAVSQSERTENPTISGMRKKGPVSYRLKKECKRFALRVFMKAFGKEFIDKQSGKIGPIKLSIDLGQYKSYKMHTTKSHTK